MTDPEPEELPDQAVVVRGGTMTAENLMNGVSEHLRHPEVYGMSVQAAVGQTVGQLAEAGETKNARLGVTTAGAIRRAGYQLLKTSGSGFHWTVVVPLEFGGNSTVNGRLQFA